MARRVVIVGSGVAGALIAKRLLETTGDSILMLEAGAHVPMADRRHWADFVTTGRAPFDDCADIPEDFTTAPGQWAQEQARLIARGGTTLHWGGWSLRLKPEDFSLKSRTGHELDWPFSYDELEPFYHQAEHALGISGDSSSDDPPRKGKTFPVEAAPFVASDAPVIRAFRSLGMSYAHLPMARSGRCVTTGTCRYCPADARYTADLTLRDIETHKRFELRLLSPAEKILLDGPRRVRGVAYRDLASGASRVAEADLVILAAGVVETPKLLLASADALYPKGIGNGAGHVGRHFKTHVRARASGHFNANPDKLHQELEFQTLCSRFFDSPSEQQGGKLFISRAPDMPSQDLEAHMAEGASVADVERAIIGPMRIDLTGQIESFAASGNEIRLAPDKTRFGMPRTEFVFQPSETDGPARERHLLKLESVFKAMGADRITLQHDTPSAGTHMGSSCRMSNDEKDGVVTAKLNVHGIDNLYICSNAVFPNIGAVNPTLTLAALALRLADHLSA